MNRKACIIGNDSYANWQRLECAINDANCIGEVLEEYGFETDVKVDLDYEHLSEAVNEFIYSLTDYSAGLLFFAGHGVEIEGRQYLVPIDAPKSTDRTVIDYLFDTTHLITNFSHTIKSDEAFTGIILLDCCRIRLNVIGRTRGIAVNPAHPKGIFIAFATEPDCPAREREEHGIFTLSICKAIKEYGYKKIEDVFKIVRKEVLEKCPEQISWDQSSLLGDFYFDEINALIKQNSTQRNDFLDEDFLEEVVNSSLSYMQIKAKVDNMINTTIIKPNCSLDQGRNILDVVLGELDHHYLKNQN